MEVGDLVYDSHYGQFGLVTEISMSGEYCTVFYEDGQADDSIRSGEVEVVNGN